MDKLDSIYRDIRMLELRREADLRAPQAVINNVTAARNNTTYVFDGEEISLRLYNTEEQAAIEEAVKWIEHIYERYGPEHKRLADKLSQLRAADSEGEVSYGC